MIASALAALVLLADPVRPLQVEAVVPASVAEVWKAWTTSDGAKTFFAPDAKIVPNIDGAYELYLRPEGALGTRGSEGCVITGLKPGRQLSFTWGFPPSIPSLRQAKATTQVTVDFFPEPGATRVKLRADGWKSGADWAEGFQVSEKHWKLVLARLGHRFRAGPIDWKQEWRPANPGELGWLAGSWRGIIDNMSIEEHWAFGGESLLGVYRRAKDGNGVFHELMVIERDGSEVALRLRTFGPGLSALRRQEGELRSFYLHTFTASSADFVDARGGDTTSLSYTRQGETLTVLLKKTDTRGRSTSTTYAFKRLP
ncbi:MAG: SRPBCC domain-containing protein [Myxococcaceae bacterium]|nr:SRPBCC domain-containing protein [Myxococcaceae bacterium]